MPTIALSGVPALKGEPPTSPAGLRRFAVFAAAALHLAVFLWLFHPWRSAPESLPTPSLPITLVFEPPAEPKPPPAQPEQEKTAPAFDRSSGPDAETTAPPPAETDEVKNEEKPAAAAPPPAPAVVAEPPAPPTPEPPRPEPPRPAARPRDEKPVPHPQPSTVTALHPRAPPSRVAPGERRTTGDPYLNAITRELDKHRTYPDLARPLGLSGFTHFVVLIDRTGNLLAMRLVQSSGSELLDRAAAKVIRDTLPFPPAPPDYPGDPITITMAIYVGPA